MRFDIDLPKLLKILSLRLRGYIRGGEFCSRFSGKLLYHYANTGLSPITKLSTKKFVRKNIPYLVQTRQIFVLRRQNVTAPERTGDKRSQHEKFWASKQWHKKVEDLHLKRQSPHNKEHCRVKIILATRISIVKCFYNKVSGGTTCFVIGDSTVYQNLLLWIFWSKVLFRFFSDRIPLQFN